MRILYLLFLFISASIVAQQQEISKKIAVIDSILYAQQGKVALPKIDSLLQSPGLSQPQNQKLSSYKVEALVQDGRYESALILSTDLLKNNKLQGVPLIRVRIARALLFEINEKYKESKTELDFVKSYYLQDTIKKDQLYGEYLYRLSSWNRMENKIEDAYKYAEQAREFGKQNKFANVEATALFLISVLKNKSENFDKISLYKEAIKLGNISGDQGLIAIFYQLMAKDHLANKEYQQAIRYVDSSFMSLKILPFSSLYAQGYKLKSKVFEEQKIIDSALFYYKLYKENSDKSLLELQIKEVSEAEAKFNYEKEAQQNEVLQNELTIEKKYRTRLIVFSLILSILLICLAVTIYHLYKRRKKIEIQANEIAIANAQLKASVSQKTLLLKELNHRVKNNLSLIISLIKFQAGEFKNAAYKNKITDLEHRVNTIALAHNQFVYSDYSINAETFQLKNYLENILQSLQSISTEQIIFKTAVSYIEVDMDTALPIGIIVNELVTNSIGHAVTKDKILEITLQLESRSDSITIFYTDNGTHFTLKNKSEGLGLFIIETMVKQLKGTFRREKSNYNLTVQIKE